MNANKQTIEEGQKLFDKYKGIADGIAKMNNPETFNANEALLLILAVEEIRITERLPKIESKLSELKKKYEKEFESKSAEVNTKIDNVVKNVSQYIGQEPIGVTDKIQPAIDKLKDADQETRNDIYDELNGHIVFLKKKYKK